jgi:hypothetical protein
MRALILAALLLAAVDPERPGWMLQECDRLNRRPHGAIARDEIQRARQAVLALQAAVARGDPKAEDLLDAAQRAFDQASGKIDAAQEDFHRADTLAFYADVALHNSRPDERKAVRESRALIVQMMRELDEGNPAYRATVERAELLLGPVLAEIDRRDRLLRNVIFGSLLASIVFAVVVFRLYRRQKPLSGKARALLLQREGALEIKTDALFKLLHRVEAITPGKPGEARGPLAHRVDELFVLVASASRVAREAAALLSPETIWRRLLRALSRKPALRAIDLLRDRPIEFHPEEGVELVLRGPLGEKERLSGPLSSYESFSLRFDELIAQFDARAAAVFDEVSRAEQEAIAGKPKRKG